MEAALNIIPPSTTNEWPVDAVGIYAWRQQQVIKLKNNPVLLAGARHYYAEHPVEFINHWMDTYDPRKAGTTQPAKSPFVLFHRQDELIQFLLACLRAEEAGLIEKARDMGATWVCCGFSVWLWLFWPGVAVGWGSRKEQLVDKLGDPDSIFEKMRMIIKDIPKLFWPEGFSPFENMSYMRIVNPETGATITGEAGDNIGRGGRKLIYFKDESAWYDRPELIEAALGDNTRVPIDLSSVNGLGNVFHRKREAGVDWCGKVVPGKTQVFVLDWQDHPTKDQKWYDTRKAKSESEGLGHVFSQEVDRDYASSVEGIMIQREWVKAAIDAHEVIPNFPQTGNWCSGLDIADGGGDTNAQSVREGVILRSLEEWGSRDTAVTARRAVANVIKLKDRVEVQYDSVSVGSGVKAEINNLKDRNELKKNITFVPWNGGASVLNPDARVNENDEESPLNKDFFLNIKAQGWRELAQRLYRTYRVVKHGDHYDPETLISFDSAIGAKLRQLEKELCQVTRGAGPNFKMMINKTPKGTKSPNCGDCVMMNYWPITSGYNLERFVNG